MNSSICWDKTPCGLVKFNRRFEGTYFLHLQVQRAKKETTMKQAAGIWVTCSSETSIDFHRITRRYIPEDRTLQYELGST
jgi:hypothetical protein